MTPVSCTPEGQRPHFKIAVPEQLAARLRGLPACRSRFSPGSLLHFFRLAPSPRFHTFLMLHFNQTHWDRSKKAPGTRNAAPAITSQYALAQASKLPPTRAREWPLPAQVAERVCSPFQGLQAHMEIDTGLSSPSSKTHLYDHKGQLG